MSTKPTRVRIASQIHAEAVAIVTLRAFGDCICDNDTPAMIRQRVRGLIGLKLKLLGLQDGDLDDAINDSAALMEQADKIVGDLLTKARVAS